MRDFVGRGSVVWKALEVLLVSVSFRHLPIGCTCRFLGEWEAFCGNTSLVGVDFVEIRALMCVRLIPLCTLRVSMSRMIF